jgi:hypothetical protein
MKTTLAGPVSSSELNESVNEGSAKRAALRARQKMLVGLEGFVSICGFGGGSYMATHPLTTMPLRYLQGTWFHTWRWPGLALFFFVGICPALVLVATIEGRRIAIVGHLFVGAGLIAWVALEAAWIVVSPGLQLLVGGVGGMILALGLGEWAKSRRMPKATTGR